MSLATKIGFGVTHVRAFVGLCAVLVVGPACSPNERGPRAGGWESGAAGEVSEVGGRGGSAGRPPAKPSDEGGEGGNGDTDPPSEAGIGGGDPTLSVCPVPRAEAVPARAAILSAEASDPSDSAQFITITKQRLYSEFVNQTCGIAGCHGAGANAPNPNAQSPNTFTITLDTFNARADLGTLALERIRSSDPTKVMPPGSGDGSKRNEDDPLIVLGERLLEWEKRGFPETFQLKSESEKPVDPEGPARPYLMSPEVGKNLTNLGTCIPNESVMGSSDDVLAEMKAKDALFASLEDTRELPDTLVETDLTSLNSFELAERGVFSYAPTYTLFSDNAGKMRYVRVPVGEKVRYNHETKDFDIPDNTRFYKTFVRKVVDKDGKVGYRKIETRLIVVRRDEQLPDGSYRLRALRASYAWDRNEEMAHRVKDPLRNGEPAADRLCPVIVDETVTRDPERNPISDAVSEYCSYMTPEELEDPSSGQVRHYAIPSTQRCDQCHMGSNNHSYVLGFNPWQVDRRPLGEGGVYEAPLEDELSQLQRLIDYGVITGIEPGQAKLEESQGARKPRNEHELTAQGYMIGNCAFCHNPNGFPVVENPVLKDLNMFPSETGGIFQFPLDKYSPRALAGEDQSVRYPYISPAFGEFFVKTVGTKVHLPIEPPTKDFRDHPEEFGELVGGFNYLGPWRSLIWRNVYTPFTYSEDGAIFIHMPRNVPGYDCRAQKIMASWMLSIPTTGAPDSVEDPLREVVEGESRFRSSSYAANTRVKDYLTGVTGTSCPSDDDIVDAKVVLSKREFLTNRKNRPAPRDDGILTSPRLLEDYQEILTPPNLSTGSLGLSDGVPDHAHWVPVDTTDAAGKWVPRRQNWKDVIVERNVEVNDQLARVIDDLEDVRLSPEQKSFSLEPLPMGIWHADCQDASQVKSSPTAGELLEEPEKAVRRWLEKGAVHEGALLPATPEQRVHFQSRGESVFRQICQNCHGREADSRSPLAATILELTGAESRVANFVDGLFGPRSAPGAFARGEFLIDRGATPEEWAVRYLLFMGLGGTQALLPREVLGLVATAPFYQEALTAPGKAGATADANMLESAQGLCRAVLASPRELSLGTPSRLRLNAYNSPFASGTGHYELWESLCTYGNQAVPIVHVFTHEGASELLPAFRAKDENGAWVYPSDHPVGTQRGEVQLGIQADNLFPWCIREDAEGSAIKRTRAAGIPDERAPICPSTLFAAVLGGQPLHGLSIIGSELTIDESSVYGNQELAKRWARRGAMNAGIAAFYYLQALTRGEIEPSPQWDFCRQ